MEITGRFFISFFPGDVGPTGDIVDEPGLLLSVSGHQTLTIDLAAGRLTGYELDGTAQDLCSALS